MDLARFGAFLLGATASLLVMGLSIAAPAKKTKPRLAEGLTVVSTFPGKTSDGQPIPVTVTVRKGGTYVCSTDLLEDESKIWSDLGVEGTVEVQFEARGYGKVVKYVTLREQPICRIAEFGKEDETYGAGPSLLDLEQRIAALEKKGR